MSLFDDLFRHIEACRSAVLPGRRVPVRVAGRQVGWILPEDAGALLALGAQAGPGEVSGGGGIGMEPGALQPAMRTLADGGRFRWRDEQFDVREDEADAVLATVDRGALPVLGIPAWGAHLNGLVRRGDGWHIWVGRRADDRPMDPGKLDNLAAGGVPAGLTPEQTLVKEAQEEAGIPEALLRPVTRASTIRYALEREEGLRRDRVACFDAILPDSFKPVSQDHEIAEFLLWPAADVLDRVRRTDDFKFNVNLVLIDLFLRRDLIQGEAADRLRAALHPARPTAPWVGAGGLGRDHPPRPPRQRPRQ